MFQRIKFIKCALSCASALLFWAAVPVFSQVMTVRPEAHHDVSPAVRDLPTVSGLLAIEHEAEPARSIPLPLGLKPPTAPDPVLQQSAAPSALAPATSLNFDGIGQGVFGFNVGVAPPDTNGAVGLTQYVQWVNLSFAVFNKANGALLSGPTAGNSLWTGFGGGCESNNSGDPIVTYDKLANRWVLSQFAVATTPMLQCVAVSTTSDATGTYNRYSFPYSNFDDYPKMGVWPDAYYVTFNMFSGNTFVGADACAYDRNAMLSGLTATQICFQQGPTVGGLLPSDADGNTPPPAGSPNYMLFFGSNALNLFKFHVNFATPSASTFTGPTSIPVAAFTALCNGGRGCVPQAGTTTRLDSLADRLMYRLAYRNFSNHESLVVNHSVAVGASGGVRWYEIQNPNGAPVVAQQSTFAPDANFRWMGSIAMDKAGDIAVGYSVSSSGMNPAIAFTGHAVSDPANTMEAETTIINGTGSQTNGLTRWGDYSAMQVDPADDCTFWYTTEYLRATGSFNWNTRIASFKFPNCNPFPTFSALSLWSAFSDAGGWAPPQYGSTIMLADINGDGKADVCGRGGLGIYCASSTGTGFGGGESLAVAAFQDSGNWNQVAYYDSIRMADVNGDGHVDICARGIAGMYCTLGNGDGTFGALSLWGAFSDAGGWAPPQYGSTIMLADINGDGKADVCGRGGLGIYCASSTGTGFAGGESLAVATFQDSGNWNQAAYYDSIRMADVNGDGHVDICARGIAGMYCTLGNGDGTFGVLSLWSAFSDAGGWAPPQYGSTIMLADINGDGKADVCARGILGIYCSLSTGTSFAGGERLAVATFQDSGGWDQAAYYDSIRMADVNGDGHVDICGRGSAGMYCTVQQ